MLTQRVTAVASTIVFLFAHLINATPTTALLSPHANNTVLYTWNASDPLCSTTVQKADCAKAYTRLCSRTSLSTSANATVGDCTALFWFDPGNTVPSSAQCTAAYEQILAVSIGGALGYDAAQNRTKNPLYAIYPSDGNANCFKAPGDSSPVLAKNALPGGGTLSTCPVSSSRRGRRGAMDVLERRQGEGQDGQDDGVVGCSIQDGVWDFGCTTVCLLTVTTATWITGPFVAAGWLACLGGCTTTGIKVYNNCQKALGHTGPDSHLPLNPFAAYHGTKRRRDGLSAHGGDDDEESSNPCLNIEQWTFQCPATKSGLLEHYRCQQKINT